MNIHAVTARSGESWARKLAPFATPDTGRGLIALGVTIALFAGTWTFALAMVRISPWLAPLAVIPGAFAIVRVFILQHDAGHGALFASDTANTWVGRALGVLTLTPYDVWRHAHALHHASHGNLDKRGHGDIDTLTVAEYRARTPFGRMKYRAYRHPLVMFVIGPVYMFLLQHRLPVGYMTKGAVYWVSAMATNLGLLALSALIVLAFGWQALLLVHLPIALLGAAIGVWLFYVQHQFDPAFWARAPQWEREKAALDGSSFYDLPRWLMWMTGHIGIHHVHHLVSRIPFWRLPEVIERYPELKGTGRLTIRSSLKCVRLTLWDEDAKRMVGFAAV
ncbi:MAG: fatty acid desaturase [Rhizobiaceae bacterium]|nr:fatty acid desaturase [Rhizobiaceae bacterium]